MKNENVDEIRRRQKNPNNKVKKLIYIFKFPVFVLISIVSFKNLKQN